MDSGSRERPQERQPTNSKRRAVETPAFFNSTTVKEAVRALADAQNLSILVGSGVSSDAGLPSWTRLLERLMRGANFPSGVAIEAQQVETTLGQASLVEAAYAQDARAFAALVAEALTASPENGHERPLLAEVGGPGETAQAIASMCVHAASGRAPRFVLTTNYDLLLEFALLRAQKTKAEEPADVKPATEVHLGIGDQHQSTPDQGRWRVHHLHGWIPVPGHAATAIEVPTGVEASLATKGNRLVLSETGYFPPDGETQAWQDALLTEVLGAESTLLIVGTSLSDPALVRHLYRTRKPRSERISVIAVVLRPQPLRSLANDTIEQRLDYERAAVTRWDAVGVRVLFADFRFQVAQFCSEIAYRRSDAYSDDQVDPGSDPRRYGARLDEWFRTAFARNNLISAEQKASDATKEVASDAFQRAQRRLSQTLRELIKELREDFGFLKSDHLALHLWCRMPRRLYLAGAQDLINQYGGICSLGLIGASDRSWNDPESVDARELHNSADRVAVRAFTQQAVCCATIDMAAWDQLIAVPISLVSENAPARRLPVGVLSINARSMRLGQPSGLASVPANVERFVELTAILAGYGRNLLDPEAYKGLDE